MTIWAMVSARSPQPVGPWLRLRSSATPMLMRKASGGGLVQSFKSGEGLVFDFTGPGRVWTQTRNPNELLGWIQAAVGTGNSGATSAGGALGGLFGRD